MNRHATLLVYGAGDNATQELLGQLFEFGVNCELRDIRKQKGGDDNLKFLLEHNLRDIPQVFMKDHTYIGNYEAAIAYAKRQPKRAPILFNDKPPKDTA